MHEIFVAQSPQDFDDLGRLVREYVTWCKARYRDEAWFIDEAFGHQALDRELNELTDNYTPPNGKALLVRYREEICACGVYKKWQVDTCEMKRLFVLDRFRGQGIGRDLCAALLAAAAHDGYRHMCLETGNLFREAIALYQALGFRPCAPHTDFPEHIMPLVVAMERTLD